MRRKYYAAKGACAHFFCHAEASAKSPIAKAKTTQPRKIGTAKNIIQPTLLPETIQKFSEWKDRTKKHGYESYIKIREFASMGTASVTISLKGEHECHLLSRGERDLHTILENKATTEEIRTQVALDPQITLMLAAEMGLRHPCGVKGGTATVMTSDFLVKSRYRNKAKWTVYSFKHKDFSDNPRTFKQVRTNELLKLECRYWELQGIEWKLIDRSQVCEIEAYNLRFFRENADLPNLEEKQAKAYVRAFSKVANFDEDLLLREIIGMAGESLNLVFDESLDLFRYLAWHRRIPLNLNERIELYFPLPESLLKNAA